MRTLDFDVIRSEARRRSCEVRLRAGMDTRKDQPHDDAHWEALLRADQSRLLAWQASGRWSWTGQRSITFR
jgi:hypothetical protein